MGGADRTRRVAIEILAEGLATLLEVARLTGVDRQLVRHWAMRAGIDVAKARTAWVGKVVQMDARVAIVLYEKLGNLGRSMGWPLPPEDGRQA